MWKVYYGMGVKRVVVIEGRGSGDGYGDSDHGVEEGRG